MGNEKIDKLSRRLALRKLGKLAAVAATAGVLGVSKTSDVLAAGYWQVVSYSCQYASGCTVQPGYWAYERWYTCTPTGACSGTNSFRWRLASCGC